MDRDGLLTEVRHILGETTADFWPDAELVLHLQEAERRFLAEERWPWLITASGDVTVSAATATVALTDGIEPHKILAVSLQKASTTRLYQPKRVSPDKGFELRTMYSTTTTHEYPEWYYVSSVADADADQLYVYTITLVPTPTSAMTLVFLYVRDGNGMASGSAEADVPVEYVMGVAHYAAGLAWLKELNGQAKAAEQFQLYGGVIDQCRAEFMTQPDDTPLVMGGGEPQFGNDTDPWMLRMPETLESS